MSSIAQPLTVGTAAKKIVNAGRDNTPFLLETSILNTDVIYISFAKAGLTQAQVVSLAAGSKLYFPKFVGALWAQANTGTQVYNLTFLPEGVESPVFQADASAFLVAALPFDLLAYNMPTLAGGLSVVVAANTFIFTSDIKEFVYNVPIVVQLYIYTATAGNLTVYRSYGPVTDQASEVFAIPANTLLKQEIFLDNLEGFNLKYSAAATFLKFAVRQIGVTFAN